MTDSQKNAIILCASVTGTEQVLLIYAPIQIRPKAGSIFIGLLHDIYQGVSSLIIRTKSNGLRSDASVKIKGGCPGATSMRLRLGLMSLIISLKFWSEEIVSMMLLV